MVRFRHLHQGAPLVPTLPPTRLLASAAQTLSSALIQTIAAGRLAAIVTVFRQSILQFLDQHLLRSHLLLQLLKLMLVALPLADARHGSIQGFLDTTALGALDLLPPIRS